MCGKCKQQGHVRKDCPSKAKRLRFSLPDVTSDTAEPIDAETGTQEPAQMPDESTAWDTLEANYKLKAKYTEVDPTAIDKRLAQNDIDSDSDEDEGGQSKGKGKGKMA